MDTASSKEKHSPNTRPRRPLSAYNLFYRYKRRKILESCASGNDGEDTIHRLLTSVSGLENYPPYLTSILPSDAVNKIRRDNIRAALEHNLYPTATDKCNKRRHRKTHGVMSFVEMNRAIINSWKDSDDFIKTVLQELSEEGKEEYRRKMTEYKNRNIHIANHSRVTEEEGGIDPDKIFCTMPYQELVLLAKNVLRTKGMHRDPEITATAGLNVGEEHETH